MEVLLAKPWTPAIDPTGYFLSEKLDGIRAIWTGTKLVTRNGNDIAAPQWFTDKLIVRNTLGTNLSLDGELWAGRGNFQDAVSIVRCASEDKGWDKIRYMVFDLPKFSTSAFEDRQETLNDLEFPSHVTVVKQTVCKGLAHLTKEMDKMVAQGGEGLMLRKPGSFYEAKRSSTLLKVKRFHDGEAEVRAHINGKGKHKGRMGALQCRFYDGREVYFEVGTGFTDAERENPPKVGSIITFRYQELTRDGVPRFPVYVTQRNYE